MIPPRLLIVGWDGGTWEVFRPLADKGLMPNLKALMHRGCHGTMNSTLPPITPPAWTTLLTGLRPERHGIFGFTEGALQGEYVGDGRKVRPLSALSIRTETILDMLGRAGRRLMSVNVPMSYPPRPINGIMITGMLTPADAEEFTWPPELRDELDGYTIDVSFDSDIRVQEAGYGKLAPEELIRRCTEVVRSRCENVLRLSERHPWDSGIVIFTATDRIFHRLWGDVTSLAESGIPSGRTQKMLREFFAELDASLGRLAESLGQGTLLLVSDHGFGRTPANVFYPDVVLEREGLLVLRQRGNAWRPLRNAIRKSLRRCIDLLLPRGLRRAVLSRSKGRLERMEEAIDLQRSRARFVMFDRTTLGAVRLIPETTSGLSAHERQDMIRLVIDLFRDLRDPSSGEPVILRAETRQQFFPGATAAYLPEIILQFREGWTGLVNPLATEIFDHVQGDAGTGVHRTDGMFVLAGPGVRRGGEVDALHLADVAPLALYLNDLPVPASMQGEVPLKLFEESWVRTHSVRNEEAKRESAAAPPEAAYTAEQEEKVKQRLRDLGYLD